MQPNDKLVLVVTFDKTDETHPDQDTQTILEALRDAVDETEVWCQDDDHDDETGYGFTVTHSEVVDADVVEVDVT